MYTYIYTHTHTHIHRYIYIYIYTLKVDLVILVCGDVILEDREELEMPTRYWHKQLEKITL